MSALPCKACGESEQEHHTLAVVIEERFKAWSTEFAHEIAAFVLDQAESTAHDRLTTTRDAIAEAVARSMPGWNEALRTAGEAHWESVNAECLRQGREYADAIFDADVLIRLSEVDNLGPTAHEPRASEVADRG